MADLHIHTLAVRNHRITCASPVLVQHGMGHDAIALDLDAEWDGLSARLVLGPCGSAYDVLYEGGPVVVPAATLAEAGWLPVSVVGYGGDGTVRVTTERCDRLLRVVESGCVDGSEPIPDAPDLLGQLVEAAGKATEAAGKADEAAENANQAAAAAGEKSLYAYADPDNDELIILEYPAFLESEDGTMTPGSQEPPVEEEWPEWVRPTSKDTKYHKGDKVTFEGARYVCNKNNVTASPAENPKSWVRQD